MSLYKIGDGINIDDMYNYFDVSSNISIKSYYDETNTNNTKFKLNTDLSGVLKHFGNIGYKINSTDIASLYVPKCYVYNGPITRAIPVPPLTNRIVFFLQATGGFGRNGDSNDNGGDGGSGALYMGYINRSSNNITTITLVLASQPGGGARNNSTLNFSGGNTTFTVTCQSGESSPGVNNGGTGATQPTLMSEVTNTLYRYGGTTGTNGSRVTTIAPYSLYPTGVTSFSDLATTTYYPLYTGGYGNGGRGGSYNGNGDNGGIGISAIWFLV